MNNSGWNLSTAGNHVASIARRNAALPCARAKAWARCVVASIGPCSGIVRVLKTRTQQHPPIFVKDILGAVAVMHVKVQDRDTLEPVYVHGVACAHSHIVENAKSHCAVIRGVVTTRSHGTKRICHLFRWRPDQRFPPTHLLHAALLPTSADS